MLRALAKNILRAGGIVAHRYEAHRDPAWVRHELFRRERIGVVLDVGANSGQYAGKLRELAYDGRIVSFEPMAAAFQRLSTASAADANWQVRRCALGDSDGMASIHVAGNSWSSSMLDMLPRHIEAAPESAYVGIEEVPLARLDTLLEQISTPEERLFLKIDTQGYTSQVLSGAHRTLERVHGLEVELSNVPLYGGEPLAHEVMSRLHAHGFYLHYVEPELFDPASGQQLQLNGLFARSARAA